jgi:autotransporter-associated beta strand protein
LVLKGSPLTTASTIDGTSSNPGTLQLSGSANVTLGGSIGGNMPIGQVYVSNQATMTTGGYDINAGDLEGGITVEGVLKITSGEGHSTLSPVTLLNGNIVFYDQATVSSIKAGGYGGIVGIESEVEVTTGYGDAIGDIGSPGTGNSINNLVVVGGVFTVNGTNIYTKEINIIGWNTNGVIILKNGANVFLVEDGLLNSFNDSAFYIDTDGSGGSKLDGNIRLNGTSIYIGGGTITGDVFNRYDDSQNSSGAIYVTGGTPAIGTIGGLYGAIDLVNIQGGGVLTIKGNSLNTLSGVIIGDEISTGNTLILEGPALTTGSWIDGVPYNPGTLELGGFASVTLGAAVGSNTPVGQVSLPAGTTLTTAGYNINTGDSEDGIRVAGTLNITSGIDSHSTLSQIALQDSGIISLNDGLAIVNSYSGLSIKASGTQGDTVNINTDFTTGYSSGLGDIGTSSVPVGTLAVDSSAAFILDGTGVYAQTITLASDSTMTLENGAQIFLESGGSWAGGPNVSLSSGSSLDMSGTTSQTLGGISGSGTISLGSQTLTSTALGINVFSGVIQDGGLNGGSGASFVMNGSGTQILLGNNTYTGGTIINVGTLNVSSDLNLGAPGDVTLAGGVLQFGASMSTARNLALPVSSTIDTQGYSVISSGVISGAGDLNKISSGTLTLSGSNTYTGGTTIGSGTLILSDEGTISSSSALVNNGTFDISATTLGLSDNSTFNSGFGTTVNNLSGSGIVTLGSKTLSVTENSNGTFSGSIQGIGALVKLGSGTLTLSGTNTYTGQTLIRDGTLALSASGSISSSSALVDNGIFDVSATTLGAQIGALSGSGTITLGSQPLSVIQSSNGIFSGLIQGTGSLTKAGSETLSLRGTNTYTGGTTVNEGTLNILADVNLGGTSGVILGGGTLQFGSGMSSPRNLQVPFTSTLDTQGYSVISSGVISGSGGLTKIGSGTLTLSGSNTYTGSTTISSGTLILSEEGTVSSSSAVVNDAAFDISGTASGSTIQTLSGSGSITLGTKTLSVIHHSNSTFSGSIQGGGDFIKKGTGTLTLSGTNTYTGNTTLNSGILAVSSDTNLGNLSSNLIFDGGTLAWQQSASTSRSAIVTSNGGFISTDNGTNLTLTGSVNGSSGTLTKIGLGQLQLSTGDSSGFTGTICVLDGEFKLNAPLGGNVIVDGLNAVISGSGSIANDLTISQGSLAPGNSIGTLTVGSFVQSPGTTYYVQLNELGESTRVDVDGSAIIDTDTTLDVTSLTGYYSTTQPYTILTTNQGITGQYTHLVVHQLAIIPQLQIRGNNLILSFGRNFLNGALTPNQKSVAEQLQIIAANPSNEQSALLDEVAAIGAEAIGYAFDQLSGEQYTNLLIAGEQNTRQVLRGQYNSLREVATVSVNGPINYQYQDVNFWIESHSSYSNYSDVLSQAGFKSHGAGVTVGAQNEFNRDWTFGSNLDYDSRNLKDNLGSCSRQSSALLGICALYRPDAYYAMLSLVGGYNEAKMNRLVSIHGTDYIAKSSSKALETMLYAELGKDYSMSSFLIQPFIGLEGGAYSYSFGNEKNADLINLDMHDKRYLSLSSRAGLHLTVLKAAQTLNFGLDLGWQHRLSSTSNHLTGQFKQFGTTYQVEGIGYERDLLDLTFTLSGKINKIWEGVIQTSGQWANHMRDCGASVGLVANF